ncbi:MULTISPECIES: type VI secretion system Vgr family protein [Campylobacterales]|uniref:type VI secretion system Vgr family protein n=1 Tax=Campylobacterales TaxID=213849 RepID=UPI001F215023|nr:type VI secretion system tip protein TssI/VgrG [Helicobacter pullorum]
MDRFLPSRENVKKFLQDVVKDKLGENEHTDMFFSDELQDKMSEALADSITPNWLPNPNQDFNIPLNLNNSYLSLTIAPNNFPKDSNDSSSTTSPIAFKITKAHIKESLEELFAVECEGYIESMQEQLISFSQNTLNIHPKFLIDALATFKITNPYNNNTLNFIDSADKSYKGIISAVNYLGLNQESSNHLLQSSGTTILTKHFFKFTLTSPLIRLNYNKANRIYTNTNIIEVIKTILNFYTGRIHKEVDFSHLRYSYEVKELITQYQESDLAFVTRLAHNNGIHFYEDDNTIYFCDDYKEPLSKTIPYNPNPNNSLNELCINSFFKQENILANSFTQSSENGAYPLNLQSLNHNMSMDSNYIFYNQHEYDSQNSFTLQADLETPLKLKEKHYTLFKESVLAKSNVYHLKLGERINIDLNKGLNKETLKDYAIIALEQTLIDTALLANTINPNDNIQDTSFIRSYTNILTIVPSIVSFAPNFKSKPIPPYSTQGIIIGQSTNIQEESNTIYSDEYGRVKVRINCFANQEAIDNHSNKDDQSNQRYIYSYSPFLRVSTPIASDHSGFYHTPRVGDEVIISYLDNDIDKPYISGSLYNNTNPSLPSLPNNNHITSLSSKTIGTKENGRNELTFSNVKDEEEIYLKAEKDYKELIQHNSSQHILNNKDSIVDGFYTERIKKAHTQTIDLAKNVNVGGEYLTNVALSKDTMVGISNTLNVGLDNKLRVGKNSHEYIGESKSVEIGGNQNITIHKDESRNIKGNKSEVVEGTLDIQSTKEININTQSQINMTASHNILFSSARSTGFQSDKNHTETAQNIAMEATIDIEEKAGNQIHFAVGSTTITATSDSVIIKAGGVEVLIDSKGLVVKGGEVRAE